LSGNGNTSLGKACCSPGNRRWAFVKASPLQLREYMYIVQYCTVYKYRGLSDLPLPWKLIKLWTRNMHAHLFRTYKFEISYPGFLNLRMYAYLPFFCVF
jgi:hypothetical protein